MPPVASSLRADPTSDARKAPVAGKACAYLPSFAFPSAPVEGARRRRSGLRPVTVLLGVLASLGAVAPAAAHPHVFANATVEIVAGPDGRLVSLHNGWWMDELFSSSVLVDFDKNGDGALDKDELAAIGKQVGSSIAEWSYYTFVTQNGAKVALTAPPTLGVTYDAQKGQLRFSFEMKPAQPLTLKGSTTTVTNFDDTYFVAFDFTGGDKAFSVKNLPKACTTTTAAPTPDQAAKSWMDSHRLQQGIAPRPRATGRIRQRRRRRCP
jgi:ABC-type uncharacterized transport system substrate-binding protein